MHPFVSTRTRFGYSLRVSFLSIAAHAVLIYVAFAPGTVLRRASGDIARDRVPPTERIRYLEIAPQREAPAPAASVPVKRIIRSAPPLSAVPRLRIASIDPAAIAGAAAIPDIDLSSKAVEVDSTVPVVPRVVDLVKRIVNEPSPVAVNGGPYRKEDVDKIVVPFGNNPKPVYPWSLQQRGIEASFMAQFVVDSTGRVDDQTLLFPPEANKLFVDSVRQSLRRARYYPAEVGGRRVRQLVEQRFTFILVGGRGEMR